MRHEYDERLLAMSDEKQESPPKAADDEEFWNLPVEKRDAIFLRSLANVLIDDDDKNSAYRCIRIAERLDLMAGSSTVNASEYAGLCENCNDYIEKKPASTEGGET